MYESGKKQNLSTINHLGTLHFPGLEARHLDIHVSIVEDVKMSVSPYGDGWVHPWYDAGPASGTKALNDWMINLTTEQKH